MIANAGLTEDAAVTPPSQDVAAAHLQSFAGTIGVFVLVAAAVVLIGWALDVVQLQRVVAGWHTMKPNTAVCFFCLALAIVSESRFSRWRHAALFRRACAAAAAAIGVLSLTQYLAGVNFGIDELLFRDVRAPKMIANPGRMAFAAAGGFLLLGIALAALRVRRLIWLVQACTLLTGFLAILCIISFIIGSSSLYAINLFRSVAFHTACLFLLATVATLLLLPKHGLIGLLISSGAGGQMARRLLPVAFFVPLLIGVLRISAHRAGLVDVQFGIALVTCSNVVLLTAAVYWCTRSLEIADNRRKRLEDSFRRVVESSPNAMAIVDRRGKIAMVNAQIEKLFEYPRARLLGHSIELLVPEHLRDQHSHRRAEFLAAPVKLPVVPSSDLVGRRRNGSQFPVEIGLTPIEFDGQPMVICTVVDLTQRRFAEQRERNRLAELAHVGRLSTVGEMVSGLAHEINQPLAAACNYARACARFAQSGGGASVEQIAELVDKTLAQTERANQIVSRMCEFVRKSPPTRADVDLNQLVRDVISLTIPADWLRSAAADPGLVCVDLDQSLPTVWADRLQIEQVLVNLVRNAIDAMHDRDPGARRLAISTSLAGGGATVVVSDSGPGIAPEHVPRVFDPFFTTKLTGIGLGLAISRSIIDAHDGRLWCESGGDGARFAFSIPVSKMKVAAA